MTKAEVEIKKEEFKQIILKSRGVQEDPRPSVGTILRRIAEINDLQRCLDNDVEMFGPCIAETHAG